MTDGSSGIAAADLVKGRTYRLTGIVGQRASRKGALDGYRLHLRDRGDIAARRPGGPAPRRPAAAQRSDRHAVGRPITTALARAGGSARDDRGAR